MLSTVQCRHNERPVFVSHRVAARLCSKFRNRCFATLEQVVHAIVDARTRAPVSSLNVRIRRAASGSASPNSIRTVTPSISPRSTAPAISSRCRASSSTVKPDFTKLLNLDAGCGLRQADKSGAQARSPGMSRARLAVRRQCAFASPLTDAAR